ncbi:DUF4011 domain-containing protein [Heyndrickxia camelliae]|uniref:DUF4011 domain-containing protein n=1 Tax=Heyndrickxia camelliae TaxID=1707093 RepID=UPI001F317D03|nr:DUF4011 domain-containing protein [Heyndrickxia camelliae]
MKDKLVYLKDRLNDLSRRNRSIRMLKLYDKWSFDITSVNKVNPDSSSKILENIIEQNGNITLLKQDVNNEATLLLSNKLNSLYRNLKSIEEETGLYDLFVGYPYISGYMLDGTYIRAPLFLYPVKLEKAKVNGINWKLLFEDGEPQLNRPLFLAFKKYSGIDVTDTIYEEAEKYAKKHDFLNWIK